MVIYDERMQRVSQYSSEESFDIETCHELLVSKKNFVGRARLGLRTYIGNKYSYIKEKSHDPETQNGDETCAQKPVLRSQSKQEVKVDNTTTNIEKQKSEAAESSEPPSKRQRKTSAEPIKKAVSKPKQVKQ